MEKEAGDDYIRRLATFIRTNEKGLAESAFLRRKIKSAPDRFSFSWPLSTPSNKPVALSTDTHHLFYILIRLEAIGFQVGSLDVPVHSPSRPMSYLHIFPVQKDPETLSLTSLRSSLSLVSNFSLSGSWWTAYDPSSIEGELKYIYSSFTKIPALSIHAPSQKVVAELLEDTTGQTAVPLDIFKNLQRLECEDIDPRTLLGWDRMADSLRSLKVKRSGLDDISQILLGAVIQDQARRYGPNSLHSQPKLTPTQQPIALSSQLLDVGGQLQERPRVEDGTQSTPSALLPWSKWSSLKHLYLPDNSLTSFAYEILPYLTSLTHLDLSSNLFVSIPPGLGELTNLVSLNISDNLIDSVQGIFLSLGQVLYLNLAHNRLESLCGLDRLLALERIDLRYNMLEESLEIGRLSVLPNLSELWVDGNPFMQVEEDFRVTCFSYFSKEGKEIRLEGSYPSLYEKRNLALPDQFPSIATQSTSSAPVISIEHSRAPKTQHSDVASSTPSHDPSFPVNVSSVGQKRKKLKRIVDFGGNDGDRGLQFGSPSRTIFRDDTKAQHTLLDRNPQTNPNQQSYGNIWEAREPDGDAPEQSAQETQVPWHAVRSETSGRHHSRHRTDCISVAPSPLFALIEDSTPLSEVAGPGSSISPSKSEKRRTRVSASSFEPSTMRSRNDDSANNMDAYRKRIESLKQDMGDGWLKVFSQSHSPNP
ncbi:hypothetical protein CPB84DRAFT_1770176 [Gymnopilus junonius]|uniref:Leucine-rich repeat-containing protein n=1 Tax=Gymnopilus junonius TaxID=109634 RepID=A0A9P5NRM6_GYMJU|nr:hypothetical protein CPB84DRAFT_1770176 [Gymnopilus junonius]